MIATTQIIIYIVWLCIIFSSYKTNKMCDERLASLKGSIDLMNGIQAELYTRRAELNQRVMAYNLIIYPDFPESKKRGMLEMSELNFSAWKN